MGESFDIVSCVGPKAVDYANLAVKSLKKNLDARMIYLIAPANIHERITAAPGVCVLDEKTVLPGIDIASLRKRFAAEGYPERLANWYYQQFLKIEAARGIPGLLDRFVIWDSDTVLLRKIDFYADDGTILIVKGENGIHEPYYETLERLFRLEVPRVSRIAQYFPLYREICVEFIKRIEAENGGKNWIECILDFIFSRKIANKTYDSLLYFSEYNALGFFISSAQSKYRIETVDIPWLRDGSFIGRFPLARDLKKFGKSYCFVAFENPYMQWYRELVKKITRIVPKNARQKIKGILGKKGISAK